MLLASDRVSGYFPQTAPKPGLTARQRQHVERTRWQERFLNLATKPVLSLGTMVFKRTAETIANGLECCRVRNSLNSCQKMLGVSVPPQRRQAYGPLADATEKR
jgi:hypothetical protein